MQVGTGQGEDREEEPVLLRHDRCPPAVVLNGVLRGEDDRSRLDVAVLAHLVRVGVVAGVLVHPPAVAQPHQQVADDAGEPFVAGAGDEDLLVCAVVREERRLREEDREVRRDEKLPRGRAQREQRGEAADVRGEQDKAARQVPARAPLHQAHLLDRCG